MTISEHTLKTSVNEPVGRFEVFAGAGRRRDWSDDDKARIVAESYEPGATVKASTKLFAEEATTPVPDPKRGRTKTGQLFAYARDERPLGRRRSARRRLSLRAGPQGRAGRHAAGRRLCGLQGPGRPQHREPGVLLEP